MTQISRSKFLRSTSFATVAFPFATLSFFATLIITALLAGCDISSPPSTNPTLAATTESTTDPAWPEVSRILERPGVLNQGVFTVTVPRDDLDISIGGMGIPTAAGIESVFYFYRCPCGKLNVAGHFVAVDYESNDVVDALRNQAVLRIASISPMLQYDNPHLCVVYFQGEGHPADLAKNLREALRWTGHERMAPQKMDDVPTTKP